MLLFQTFVGLALSTIFDCRYCAKPYRSRHSTGLAIPPLAQTPLLYRTQIWTHHSPICLHLAIAIAETLELSCLPESSRVSYSGLLLCTSCKLNNSFDTSTSRRTVQLHVKSSPRHFTPRTASSRSPFFECLAAQSLSSFSQLSLPPSSF